MKLVSLVGVVCLLVGVLINQNKPTTSVVAKVDVLTDLEEALVQANKTSKPVFVYVFDSV